MNDDKKNALRYMMWAGTILSDVLGRLEQGSTAALRLTRADLTISQAIVEIRKGASRIVVLGYVANAKNALDTCYSFQELHPDLVRLKACLQLAVGEGLTSDTKAISDQLHREMAGAESEAEVRAACPVLMRGLAHG